MSDGFFVGVLQRRETAIFIRIQEVVLALLAIFWGAILLLPGDLFAGIERYRFYGQYAPDTVWGVVMALCGVLILLKRPHWAHRHAHWILCTVWTGMTWLSLLSLISPPVLLIASLCAALSLIHASAFWQLQYPPAM